MEMPVKERLAKWFVLLATASCIVTAQDQSQSALPASLRTPSDQKLIFHAHGAGDQIYTCAAADGTYAWKLKGPDAQLIGTDGQVVGHHFAGPTWQSTDGSSVTGKAVGNVASPDSTAVPWLLLLATRHDGNGRMNEVLSIQRLDTKGGKAPNKGCDGAHAGNETRVPYQAEYYFFGQAK